MWRRFLAFWAHLVIRLLRRLWRYRYVDRHHSLLTVEAGRPVLYAFHHGKQLMLLGHIVPLPMVQMVSLSKDGDLQSEILRLLGFTVVRGSPGRRGTEALYEMGELVLNGCHAALAVDGSRGPLHTVKPGILHLARDTEGAIIPLVAAARRSFVLKRTWDHYEIPWPFTRVVILEGEPITLDADIDEEEFEQTRQKLERRLLKLSARAQALAAGRETPIATRTEAESGREKSHDDT